MEQLTKSGKVLNEVVIASAIQVINERYKTGMAKPISIGDFARQKRTFTWSSELGDIDITYRPYQMTPAREADIARIAADAQNEEDDEEVRDTDKGISKIVQQFCEVVEALSLVGPLSERTNPITGAGEGRLIIPAGDPIPIVPDVVKYFSSSFILAVFDAVGKDSRPKSKKIREISQDIS